MNIVMKKIIAQGAEAKIERVESCVIKNRIRKYYRIDELDKKIRKRRTKAEEKLLKKAGEVIDCPKVLLEKDFDKIKMEFIDGKKLANCLDKFSLGKQKEIVKKIGELVFSIHDKDIIHGDLTTSNMILKDEKIFFIDFGLGYISKKIEDKAVDLHLFKQALEAKHFENWRILYKEFEKGYSEFKDSKKIFEQLARVEKRGRYKH